MLTEKGYQRPTYDELLEGQIQRAKLLFGEDIDTSETAILGKFIRLQVYDLAEAYEDLENIYYGRFPNTARGISLDRLLPFAGITRNLATYAQYQVRFIGTIGAVIEAGVTVVSETGLLFHTIEEKTVEKDGRAYVLIECAEAGIIGNQVEQLELESPSAEITDIEIVELTSEGQDKESDTAVRRRFQISKAGSGSNTQNSVKGAIMRVPNVTAVEVLENKTSDTINGLPPHSFQCYVLCPDYVNQQVAEAIFSKKPLGIPCVGNLVFQVKDDGGQLHEIKFSKSEAIEIQIELSVKVNQYFEETGVEQIKDNLVEYISGLENGQDVILTSLYGQIHKVEGVMETTKLMLAKKGEETKVQNIVCDIYQVADICKEDMVIEVTSNE